MHKYIFIFIIDLLLLAIDFFDCITIFDTFIIV